MAPAPRTKSEYEYEWALYEFDQYGGKRPHPPTDGDGARTVARCRRTRSGSDGGHGAAIASPSTSTHPGP